VIVTADSVREYMSLNTPASTSKYTDATLGSNIRAAQGFLSRATGRRFEDVSATLTFSTDGRALIPIPGLRSAGQITLQGANLTADQTYWLIPDAQQTGVCVAIQLRGFQARPGGASWLGNPEWFDRGLDSPYYPANRGGGSWLPNDLVIPGSWGWTDALMPEDVRHAVKVLAAYYTKRPDAILTGGYVNPDGSVVDLSGLPIEVQAFIADWKVGSFVQAAG
jgi:hypothetical protein